MIATAQATGLGSWPILAAGILLGALPVACAWWAWWSCERAHRDAIRVRELREARQQGYADALDALEQAESIVDRKPRGR